MEMYTLTMKILTGLRFQTIKNKNRGIKWKEKILGLSIIFVALLFVVSACTGVSKGDIGQKRME